MASPETARDVRNGVACIVHSSITSKCSPRSALSTTETELHFKLPRVPGRPRAVFLRDIQPCQLLVIIVVHLIIPLHHDVPSVTHFYFAARGMWPSYATGRGEETYLHAHFRYDLAC